MRAWRELTGEGDNLAAHEAPDAAGSDAENAPSSL